MSNLKESEKVPLLESSGGRLAEEGDIISENWKALSSKPRPTKDRQLEIQEDELQNGSNQYLHHRIYGSANSTQPADSQRQSNPDLHGRSEPRQDSTQGGPMRSALGRRDQSQEPPGNPGDLALAGEGGVENEQKSVSDQLVMVTLLHGLLLVVALVFSQSLSTYMFTDKDSAAAQITLIVLMTIGTGVVLCLYCRNDVAIAVSRSKVNRSVREKLKHILRNYLPVVGMLFFYPFSCALDLFNVIVGTGCSVVFKYCDRKTYQNHIVDVAFHIVRPIFMGAELFFCLQFHKSHFRQRTDVRTGLVFVMAVNLGLWFISLLYETEFKFKTILNPNQTGPCNLSLVASEDLKKCLNHKTKEASTLRNVNLFLYPFAIEFTLLFGEFIADKLFNCKPLKVRSEEPRRKPRRIQAPPTRSEFDGTFSVGSIGDQSVEVPLRSFFSGSTLILAVGVIVNVANCVLGYLSFDSGLFGNFDVHEVYYSFSIVYWSLLTFLSLVGFVCSRSFVYRNEVMRGIDYMVLLTGLGPTLLEMITLTAYFKGSQSSTVKPPIMIASRVASIVQLIVQVPFMFYCDRVKPRETDRSDPRVQRLEAVFKAIVLYQALCNGATWIVDSILSADTEVMEQISKRSQIFFEIVSPFAIFFRFNSLLLFLRAYLGE